MLVAHWIGDQGCHDARGCLAISILAAISCSCAKSPEVMIGTLDQVDPMSVVTSNCDALSHATVIDLANGKRLSGELAPGDAVLFAADSNGLYPALNDLDDVVRRDTEGMSDSTSGNLVLNMARQMSDMWTRLAMMPMGSTDIPPRKRVSSPLEMPTSCFRTYYDLFKILVKEPCAYEITVEAVSDVWNSTVIKPFVRLLTSDAVMVSQATAPESSWGTPEVKLTGQITSAGEYFILVGAENAWPGDVIGSGDVWVGGGVRTSGNQVIGYNPGYPMSIPFRAAPEGKYEIRCRLRVSE